MAQFYMSERITPEKSEMIQLKLSGGGILDEGVIEYLVLSKRIPTFWAQLSYDLMGRNEKLEGYFCEIPPPGIKRTDIRKRFPIIGEREHVSRRGASRGFSTILSLSREIGEKAMIRVNEVVEQYSVPK